MPLTFLEQEVFCECGSWKNFHDLEDSLSLDELIVLYEATMERQNRVSRTMAASLGAEVDDSDPYNFLYSDTDKKEESGNYQKSWMVDPKTGGEIVPAYGEQEINQLPINLGYSIIKSEDS